MTCNGITLRFTVSEIFAVKRQNSVSERSKMIHRNPLLDPAFGDPYRYRHQKGMVRGAHVCPMWSYVGFTRWPVSLIFTLTYYRPNFHADRPHRRRDIWCPRTQRKTKIERITADLISDKQHTSICRIITSMYTYNGSNYQRQKVKVVSS